MILNTEKDIKNTIYSAFNRNKTLVFTSELVAENWMANYLKDDNGKTAVFRDRAISWDTFKQQLINTDNKKPADNITRNVFAARLLEDDDVFAKLCFFSNPGRPESKKSYASAIASYLPSFAYFDININTIGNPKDKEELLRIKNDIDEIKPRYEQFLDENNIYEYNYLYMRQNPRINPSAFLFVFPETFNDPIVTEGIFQYMTPEEKEGCILTYGKTDRASLVEYENSTCEVRDVFRQIHKLLTEENVNSYDIAITCANVEGYRPFMEEEAEKYDLQLHFTTSRNLILSSQGKFFIALDKIKKEEFSFASIKNLLLNPIFPFKEEYVERNRRILNYAVASKLANGPLDNWIIRIKKFPDSDDDLKYFIAMTESLSSIIDAETPEEINKNAVSYVNTYFKTENLQNADALKNWNKCLSLLHDLQYYPQDYDIWTLFLAVLGDTTYIDRVNNGIKVYTYPVSAGISIPYHFIIGLSDDRTAVSFDKYPYWKSKKDMYYRPTIGTDVTISLMCSPVLCRNLFICGTTKTFDGSHLLPVSMLKNVKPALSAGASNRLDEDFYEVEKRSFTESGKIKEITGNQYRGYASASVILGKEKTEFPSPEELQGESKEKPKNISASYFKCYTKCPYFGFVSIYFRPEEKQFDPQAWDAMVVGNILHSAIQMSLEEVKHFNRLNSLVLNTNLQKAIDTSYKNFELCSPSVKDAIYGKYSKILSSINDAGKPKTAAFVSEDFELLGNEINYNRKGKGLSNYLAIDGVNIAVGGRPDTILKYKKDGKTKYVLLDYKTTGADDYDSDISKCSPQIAIYARMIEANEKALGNPDAEVSHAAYYSINKEDMMVMWPEVTYRTNGEKTQGNNRLLVDETMKKQFDDFRSSVEKTSFEKNGAPDICKKCYYRSICRKEFTAQ